MSARVVRADSDARGLRARQSARRTLCAFALSLLLLLASPLSHAAAPGAYVQVSAGTDHTCARLATGGVHCWGHNNFGQLGDNSTTDSNVPVSVAGISSATDVSAGDRFSCARLTNAEVWCWGLNSAGKLGNATTANSPVPVQVSLSVAAMSVSAGFEHACVRTVSARAHCWGNGFRGQLGNGATTPSLVPVAVTGLTNVTAVSAGTSHTCARLADGTVRCWGAGANGQLGNNGVADSNVPVVVNLITAALPNATSVSAAGGGSTCARMSDATLRCWGFNSSGQLGDNTSTQRREPVSVLGVSATTVETGRVHACARMLDETVQCWGAGENGRLGYGGAFGRLTAVAVVGVGNVTQVSAGAEHTCAVLSTGAVVCWGSNGFGQIGNGTSGTDSLTPSAVLGGPCTLDIDGNGSVSATTDGVLLNRILLGFGGAAVTQNALSPNAPRGDWTKIRAYLSTVCGMTGLAPA